MAEYVYDTSLAIERQRLRALEANQDPGTIAALDVIGVEPGWHCLEVGGGGGSIARLLCDRTGPGGRVVATDLDTRFLEEINATHLEVRRHDITRDDLEREAFDLVHSRAVLEHLPGWREALSRMIGAVKPGGWILVEDVDFGLPMLTSKYAIVWPPKHAGLYVKVFKAVIAMLSAAGADVELGRKLPTAFLEAGLNDVQATSRSRLVRGGPGGAGIAKLGLTQFRARLVAEGRLTEQDVERALEAFDDPAHATMAPTFFAVWGRKPA